MSRTIVQAERAPEAIGAYSQAVVAGGFVFCSGQVPLDPETGELVSGSLADETKRCLDNLSAVLEGAGSGLDKVVKVTAFLIDMGDFPEFNEAYARFFPHDPPARAAIGVSALPKGARIEVECVALA